MYSVTCIAGSQPFDYDVSMFTGPRMGALAWNLTPRYRVTAQAVGSVQLTYINSAHVETAYTCPALHWLEGEEQYPYAKHMACFLHTQRCITQDWV
jgi:hypothetical protein